MHSPISFSFFSSTCELRILSALRQIIRSFELHSRELYQRFKITVPQMVCLLAVSASGGINLSQLAQSVSLSGSTVCGIINRLERRGFIRHRRDRYDRRRITLHLTASGRRFLDSAPPLMQDNFSARFSALPKSVQQSLASSLEQIVVMMAAVEELASPHLAVYELPASLELPPPTESLPVSTTPATEHA